MVSISATPDFHPPASPNLIMVPKSSIPLPAYLYLNEKYLLFSVAQSKHDFIVPLIDSMYKKASEFIA